MTREQTPTAVAEPATAPHWAATLAREKVDRDHARRDQQAHQADAQAQIAAAIKRDGASWMVRLSHELRRIASAVDTAVGRPVLDVRIDPPSFCVTVRTAADAWVVFRPAPADVDRVHVSDLTVGTASPQERWRTEIPYTFSLDPDGALVIDGHGPEAFARVVMEPWLRTLPLAAVEF